MTTLVSLEPLEDFRLRLRYSDGVTGEVDLSHLAGQGVFRGWREPGVFEAVKISSHGSIAWPEEIELCPDSLYLQLTSKVPEELFPKLAAWRRAENHELPGKIQPLA